MPGRPPPGGRAAGSASAHAMKRSMPSLNTAPCPALPCLAPPGWLADGAAAAHAMKRSMPSLNTAPCPALPCCALPADGAAGRHAHQQRGPSRDAVQVMRRIGG